MTEAPIVQTEKALVAALLMEPGRFFDVAERVAADDFSDVGMRLIFAALGAVSAETLHVTIRLVADRITSPPDGMDPITYLASLAATSDGNEDIGAMAAKIAEASARRKQAAAMADLVKTHQTGAMGAEEFAALATERLIATLPPGGGRHSASIGDLLDQAFDKLANPSGESGVVDDRGGIVTGLTDVDAILSAMLPGELVVLGGPSSFGKTTLALQIALGAARRGYRVDFHELEMSGLAVAKKVLASGAKIPGWMMRKGGADADTLERAFGKKEQMKALVADRFMLHWRPGCTVAQIRMAALGRRSREDEIGLVVVDHTKLVKVGGKADQDRILRIALAMEQLKALAKEANCVVLALSQLTRGSLDAARTGKRGTDLRPSRDHLYGGGDPVENADIIILGHRPWQQLTKMEPSKRDGDDHVRWSTEVDYWKGKAEIVIDKFRDGPQGQFVTVGFDEDRARFVDLAPDLDRGEMWG